MSTLSQAFIKAYQRQQVVPAPHAAFFSDAAPAELDAVEAAPQPPDEPGALASEPPLFEFAAEDLTPPSEAPETPVPAAAAAEGPATASPIRTSSADLFQAALEVEQFDWPEAADCLREAAAEQLTAWKRQFTGPSTTFMVTSQHRGEGRTTVLLATARHLALTGQGARVVLVDADFESPQLAQRLGVAVEIGWEDVFAGRQPLAEALVESAADRVTLLSLREAVPARKVLANSIRLTATLRTLQQHFDFVCLDAGPLADAADMVQSAVFGIETGIDAALVVRDLRHAHCEENAAMGRRLAQLGVAHWDLVENFVQAVA